MKDGIADLLTAQCANWYQAVASEAGLEEVRDAVLAEYVWLQRHVGVHPG